MDRTTLARALASYRQQANAFDTEDIKHTAGRFINSSNLTLLTNKSIRKRPGLLAGTDRMLDSLRAFTPEVPTWSIQPQ
jgi:hypothetical protein